MATERTERQRPAEGSEAVVALRDGLLRRSWDTIALLERIGHGPAARLLRERSDIDESAAKASLQPLAKWPHLPVRSFGTYTAGTNHVRLARLLDFVLPGDRVLDIGIGYGYVTSTLMRTGLPSYYAGFDLTQRFVDATYEGLQVNGIDASDVHVEVGDLYELTADWVAAHDPDLVLLLEVLEHVPDTPKAFETLGAALGPDTSILFTVPMLGRLEGVTGHLSLFDRSRIEALCAAGGLTIQYVEPLHNTWTLVLATTTPAVPQRLAGAAGAVAEPVPSTLRHEPVFTQVELRGDSLEYRRSGRPNRGRTRVKSSRAGVRADIAGLPDHSGPFYGGVAVTMDRPGIIRLQVDYDDLEPVAAVFVDGYDGDERVARWKWEPKETDEGGQMIHVLKPSGGGRFTPVGRPAVERVDRVELYLELKPDRADAGFLLSRAAYAGGSVAD